RLSLPALHSRLLSWCPLPSDDVTLAAAPPPGSKLPAHLRVALLKQGTRILHTFRLKSGSFS
ncbi:hypothetical protein COCVIDRAFT_100746, partial [Bipolaris victoriae FI3]